MAADWLLALFDVVAIAVVAWVGGIVARHLGQPRIAGEMTAVFVAGLLLGGQIADVVPGQHADGRIGALFPDTALMLVTAVGGLGFVLYMLLVGISVDLAPMRHQIGPILSVAAATAGAMIVLALVAGPLLVDAGGWKPPGVSEGAFVLAVAATLAANGLPVVARILEDRALQHRAVASIVIVAATVATAVALVAAAVAMRGGDVSAGAVVALRVGLGLVLLAVVIAVARSPGLALGPAAAPFAIVALAGAAAWAGEQLLSSLLIGPLVVGIAVVKGGRAANAVERRLGVAVRRIGLPAFLGLAALHTDLREIDSTVLAPVLAMLAAVTFVKFSAGYVAARLAGLAAAEARSIGGLMQCGGVMTIAISLDVFDAHLVDARMHATLTLVGLTTTFAAGPLMARARPRPSRAPAVGHAGVSDPGSGSGAGAST